MNITKGQFRWLVTASLVLGIGGGVLSWLGEAYLPEPLRDYVSDREHTAATVEWIIIMGGVPFVIAWVVSVIGLYRFWRIARPLTLVVQIWGLLLQAFLGPTVELAITNLLYQAGSLLTGVIIAIIYLTPAKTWFERHTANSTTPKQAAPS